MLLKTFLSLFIVVLTASAMLANSDFLRQQTPDPISGEWDASFRADEIDGFGRKLKLKLDGAAVTGTFESGQHGTGTIRGSWSENKLNLTMESAQGTMTLTAVLKKEKLVGEWDVGHVQGKWEARKK